MTFKTYFNNCMHFIIIIIIKLYFYIQSDTVFLLLLVF